MCQHDRALGHWGSVKVNLFGFPVMLRFFFPKLHAMQKLKRNKQVCDFMQLKPTAKSWAFETHGWLVGFSMPPGLGWCLSDQTRPLQYSTCPTIKLVTRALRWPWGSGKLWRDPEKITDGMFKAREKQDTLFPTSEDIQKPLILTVSSFVLIVLDHSIHVCFAWEMSSEIQEVHVSGWFSFLEMVWTWWHDKVHVRCRNHPKGGKLSECLQAWVCPC